MCLYIVSLVPSPPLLPHLKPENETITHGLQISTVELNGQFFFFTKLYKTVLIPTKQVLEFNKFNQTSDHGLIRTRAWK